MPSYISVEMWIITTTDVWKATEFLVQHIKKREVRMPIFEISVPPGTATVKKWSLNIRGLEI